MRFISLAACALAGMFSAYLVQPLAAQTAEQLAFIPAGGRTLLTNIATSKPPADELKPLLTGKRSRDEWSSAKSRPSLGRVRVQSVRVRFAGTWLAGNGMWKER